MALFGFSPLLLSALASRFFTYPATGLNVTHFLAFLAALSGLIHLFGAICMQGAEEQIPITTPCGEDSSTANTDSLSEDPEQEPLLASTKKRTSEAVVYVIPVPEPQHGTIGDLLRDPYFWLLTIVCLVVIGVVRFHPVLSSPVVLIIL